MVLGREGDVGGAGGPDCRGGPDVCRAWFLVRCGVGCPDCPHGHPLGRVRHTRDAARWAVPADLPEVGRE